MKCPYCNKEIKNVKEVSMFDDFILPNLIPVTFVVGMFIVWLVPLDIKHGYAIEYDILIMFIFMILYAAYLVAYKHGKVKGMLVLTKKEAYNGKSQIK